jgi:hypothetical protein
MFQLSPHNTFLAVITLTTSTTPPLRHASENYQPGSAVPLPLTFISTTSINSITSPLHHQLLNRQRRSAHSQSLSCRRLSYYLSIVRTINCFRLASPSRIPSMPHKPRPRPHRRRRATRDPMDVDDVSQPRQCESLHEGYAFSISLITDSAKCGRTRCSPLLT